MTATVRDLILILQIFFPPDLSLHKALYLLGFLISLYPLLRLHLNQQRQPRQPTRTAWLKSILVLLRAAFQREDLHPPTWASGQDGSEEFAKYIWDDLGGLYMMLGLNPHDLRAPAPDPLFPPLRPVLCTQRLSCVFCLPTDLNIVPTLRRRENPQVVWLLDDSFHWIEADLVVAHCASCRADYYPDRITYKDEHNRRKQRLETAPRYIRVSKHGVWADRRVAVFQENALNRFHAGWSNFADWLNGSTGSVRKLTYRQSQRLFIEHFSRRLLVFHQMDGEFSCEAHPSTRLLSEAVRAAIGVNGGVVMGAMSHACVECTHLKRYHADLVNEGVILGASHDVAGAPAGANIDDYNCLHHNSSRRLWTENLEDIPALRLWMKCALDMCEGPLVNYRDGRFCENHLNLRNTCGIIPCGRDVHSPGALTCDIQSHIDWHRHYENRFGRVSFPGVQRVIRRQQEDGDRAGPELHVDLPALGDTPGDKVVHTFKAKTIYCLQTVQWACGYPIGWDNIWEHYPDAKPSFIAYDDACSLLRHIVTQNSSSHWLSTTKFIVDAWHYINHQEDTNGTRHQTRAFNTETAEQLNSWLNGFESQLRQMTDVNYDFFVHVLLMLYGERVETRVQDKGLDLSDEFWFEATGN
ncbi:hypothetical protein MVEN_02349600 [Mycena venus]|uniref:CxC5 like cysteine cluster associated with KDZ domain-containing protein n=1 Tax=Mycena venus TaxID=2733690 RepID=A0A8H7CFA7_9AGAR|nr:hypothetical protein MVEN_02349600 [Mycena venus]